MRNTHMNSLKTACPVRTPPAIGLHGCLPGLERWAGNRRMRCLFVWHKKGLR